MSWRERLEEFQSELYSKIIDYINKNGNNDLICLKGDTLYFNINNNWVEEYSVDLFDVVDIFDEITKK